MKFPFLAVLTLLLLPRCADAFLLDFLADLLCFLTMGLFFCEDTTEESNGVDGTWDVQLDLHMPDEAKPFFEAAAARWGEVINQGVPDVSSFLLAPILDFDALSCAYPATIDDFYLCAVDGYIDGPGDEDGSVLGFARIIHTRPFGDMAGIPFVGFSKFETGEIGSSIARGIFKQVVLHEMGHAIGAVAGYMSRCPSTAFSNSPNANREFQTLSGCTFNAPTDENCGQ